MENSSQGLATTETTLHILNAIRRHHAVTTMELVSQLDIARSTVYKHLKTLQRYGYVEKIGDRYVIGARIFDIGMAVRRRAKVFQIAGRFTVELSRTTSEEADFGIEENGRLITLFDRLGTRNEPSYRSSYYQYLHATAIGKCYLAKFTPNEVEKVIDRWGLPQVTEYTITDETELAEELEKIREQGYATNDRESRAGKRTVGMLVEYPDNQLIGGFSVCGPEYRLSKDDLHNLAPTVRQVIDDFVAELSMNDLLPTTE